MSAVPTDRGSVEGRAESLASPSRVLTAARVEYSVVIALILADSGFALFDLDLFLRRLV